MMAVTRKLLRGGVVMSTGGSAGSWMSMASMLGSSVVFILGSSLAGIACSTAREMSRS